MITERVKVVLEHTIKVCNLQCLEGNVYFSEFQYRSIFHERGDLNCTTKGVIYLLQQYVGETGFELRIRRRGHRQEYKRFKLLLGSSLNFELIEIEKIRNNTKRTREEIELRWIYRLNTFTPIGLNVRDLSLNTDYSTQQLAVSTASYFQHESKESLSCLFCLLNF